MKQLLELHCVGASTRSIADTLSHLPEAEQILPEVFLDCLRNIQQPFLTPIYDVSAPRLVHGPGCARRRRRLDLAPAYGFWRIEGGR